MENELKKIIGGKVIRSAAGGAAGSILQVKFDNKSYFFIWCAWRIEKNNEVIVTSSDTFEAPDGVIQKQTPVLEGNKVLGFNLTAQYDLDLLFENGYKLRVFCDVGHSRDDYSTNWEYNMPKDNISFIVNNHFEVVKFPYDEPIDDNASDDIETIISSNESQIIDNDILQELEELRQYKAKKEAENPYPLAVQSIENALQDIRNTNKIVDGWWKGQSFKDYLVQYHELETEMLDFLKLLKKGEELFKEFEKNRSSD